MSFNASYFIYNSIVSMEYGLTISAIGDSGVKEYSGADVSLFTETLYRRPRVYLLGVQETPILEIPISIMSQDTITASQSSIISKWLFGKTDFKKLQIIQPDMQDIYYNCIFTNPKAIKVGNLIKGYKASIICDSPFAWEFISQRTYDYGMDNYLISETITYNNETDSEYYTYPILEFKMNAFGDSISIINLTDDSREFTFSDLDPDEVVTVDNDLQIITSSSEENRVNNFSSHKWFRLLPGVNKLVLSGGVSMLRIIIQNAKKII